MCKWIRWNGSTAPQGWLVCGSASHVGSQVLWSVSHQEDWKRLASKFLRESATNRGKQQKPGNDKDEYFMNEFILCDIARLHENLLPYLSVLCWVWCVGFRELAGKCHIPWSEWFRLDAACLRARCALCKRVLSANIVQTFVSSISMVVSVQRCLLSSVFLFLEQEKATGRTFLLHTSSGCHRIKTPCPCIKRWWIQITKLQQTLNHVLDLWRPALCEAACRQEMKWGVVIYGMHHILGPAITMQLPKHTWNLPWVGLWRWHV